jgi:hypothetical protein
MLSGQEVASAAIRPSVCRLHIGSICGLSQTLHPGGSEKYRKPPTEEIAMSDFCRDLGPHQILDEPGQIGDVSPVPAPCRYGDHRHKGADYGAGSRRGQATRG